LISISVEKEAESVSKIFDSAYADEKEIFSLLSADAQPEALIDLAKAGGGGDNITVVTITDM
jgi:serine/threonine protein phosphatase PrpC